MPELRQNSRNIKCYNKIGIQSGKNANAKQRAQLLSETGKKRIMEIGFLFCQFRKEGKVAGEKREAGKDTKKTFKMTEREIRGDSSHLEDQVMKTAALFFGEDLLPFVGVEGKIAGIAPTEQIHLKVTELQRQI